MRIAVILLFLFLSSPALFSQDKPAETGKGSEKAKPKAAPKAAPKANRNAPVKPNLAAAPIVGDVKSIIEEGKQVDLPGAALVEGSVYVATLEWSGESDSLHLDRETETGFERVATLMKKGTLQTPVLAAEPGGKVWCFFGALHESDDTVDLVAMSWSEERGVGDFRVVANSDAAEAFVDAGTDAKGRIWIAWQSLRAGEGDVFARCYDPEAKKWSDEIPVAVAEGGDWEPRLAFDRDGNAWVLFDSSRGNEFNLYLSRVDGTSHEVTEHPIAHSDRYEARASLALDVEGNGFWIAGERGRVRWGLDVRGHGNDRGINAQKEVLFGHFDIGTGDFTQIPLGPAGEAGNPVNLPVVGVGASGDPWVVYRYFDRKLWRMAVTTFRRDKGTWSARRRIEGGSYGQDRRSFVFTGERGKGDVKVCWASDGRLTKEHQVSAVHLVALRGGPNLPEATPPGEPKDLSGEPFAASQSTPERPAHDRHGWKVGEQEYGLYWGDLHRHTDVSNCRTGFDGCIVEHFRYAYDIAKIDFLGTSDHTDVGKFYHPYEWWHNQRMHDALHSPGRFNTLYVYEREQRWPWGHRNVVFAQRGGPVVYIKRSLYRESPWQETLPVKAGVGEITPMELWDILDRYGKPAALISHTGATGMGTDWGKYDRIDHRSENLVEIFQGARVSYEAEGAPQPTAGLRPGEAYTVNGDAEGTPPAPIDDFGKFKAGTYQNALELGRKLGVFASSDHISQHVSYGGVYCKEFTREGIIEGFDARRTIAATDKIYLEFTCNGELLGTEIKTEKDPVLWFRVDGTAPIRRATIVRNEENWKVFEEIDGTTFDAEVVDDAMLEGENRYYIRIEQTDGNMAWSSPVWVTRQ